MAQFFEFRVNVRFRIKTAGFGSSKREKWLRGFARVGLGAHGVVYCLMSLLSVMAALGYRRGSAGKEEAFKAIHEQPFGQGILFIIGVALLGYVMLRFFQAFKDTRHEGKDLRGLLQRTGCFFIGMAYLALSYTCLKLAFSNGGDGEGDKKMLLARALQDSTGVWLVGIGGAILAVVGITQVWRGATQQFMKFVDLHDSKFEGTFRKIGMAGFIARGIVFCILGVLLVRAALNANPREAEDTNGAIDFIRRNFGPWVMAVVSAGLFAFGVFMLVRSKHEKMNFDQ